MKTDSSTCERSWGSQTKKENSFLKWLKTCDDAICNLIIPDPPSWITSSSLKGACEIPLAQIRLEDEQMIFLLTALFVRANTQKAEEHSRLRFDLLCLLIQACVCVEHWLLCWWKNKVEHTYCFVLNEYFSSLVTRQGSRHSLFTDKDISLWLTPVMRAPP